MNALCVDVMIERQVQMALADHIQWWRMCCIPNLNRWHEMDFTALTKAGYLWEYEIKVDQRDWERDRLKDLPRDPDKPLIGWNRPRRNQKHVKRFYYVYARGLVCPEWVADDVGLIEAAWHISDSWRAKKGERVLRLREWRAAQVRKVPKVPDCDQEAMWRSAYHRFWRLMKERAA